MSESVSLLSTLLLCFSFVFQLLSCIWFFVTPWTAACQASLSVLHYLPQFAQIHVIESVILSNHLILCCPLLLLPSIFSCIMVFSNELALCIRWPKDWSFSFSISPSNEYLGPISFRTDWFDLLAIQRALKNLVQHHSLKASILWHLVFFMVQLSHLYMTTAKTVALTTWPFVGEVMSLVFNTLPRFDIAFLPRSQCLLISWLQSLSIVILKPEKIKSVTASTFPLLFAVKWWDRMPWS